MKAALIGLVVLTSVLPLGAAGAQSVFNIREHGAVGDGKTLDRSAINAAIAACNKAGGGQVLVPPGRYLTGTVRMLSNVTLLVDAGAEIVGTPDLDQYENFDPPQVKPGRRQNNKWHRALVLGVDVENVTITGRGTINGNKVFDPTGEEKMRGPHGILFGNSKNIVIRDVNIHEAANYAIMLEFTSDVEVRGVKVTGGWDGVHFRGWKDRPCRNIKITDSEFYTGDDAIAGWYWEDTLIARNIINSSCNGIRLIGPAKRLIVHDCLFYGPGKYEHRTSRDKHRTNMLAGILLQPGAWDRTEGEVDQVQISNITMHDVTTPFNLNVTPGNTAGRITINGMTATGVYRAAASVESWAEQPVEHMVFRNVDFEFTGGGRLDPNAAVGKPRLDARELPVWGIYAHQVKKLDLHNVRLRVVQPDARPAVKAYGVGRIEIDGLRLPPGGALPFSFDDVGGVTARDSDIKPGS